jgi:UDP-glucose 4-epimerase
VRADIRNPMIGRILEDAEVDTVVHMNVIATPTLAGGRTPQKEINVIGTMQLLGACQKSASVRGSSSRARAAVYGATPRDPAMFTEDMSAKRIPTSGFGKDSIEVEGYVRGFARRRPDVDILTMRFANIVGPADPDRDHRLLLGLPSSRSPWATTPASSSCTSRMPSPLERARRLAPTDGRDQPGR